MTIRLTDKKNSQEISFLDSVSKQLTLCYCTIKKGYEDADKVNLQISFDKPAKNKDKKEISTEFIFLKDFKEGVLSKPPTNIYINKKYRIAKSCQKMVITANSAKTFDLDCVFIIR